MINGTELENNTSMNHGLPIEAIESMLKLVLLMKEENPIETAQQSNNFVDFIRSSPLNGC